MPSVTGTSLWVANTRRAHKTGSAKCLAYSAAERKACDEPKSSIRTQLDYIMQLPIEMRKLDLSDCRPSHDFHPSRLNRENGLLSIGSLTYTKQTSSSPRLSEIQPKTALSKSHSRIAQQGSRVCQTLVLWERQFPELRGFHVIFAGQNIFRVSI